jgi:hypothetical protein
MKYKTIGLLAVLVACGDGSDRGGTGAACVSGAGCEVGLYCEVSGTGVEGVCKEAPAACGDRVSCDQACTAELANSCGTAEAHCVGLVNEYTIGCQPSPPPRAVGEQCSVLVWCQAGLFCDIKDFAEAGTCVALPDSCGGEASCACLQSVIDACAYGRSCSVVIDLARGVWH